MTVDPLRDRLAALEAEIHHPGTRCTRERLDELLHPAFHEVGRLGARYTREELVTFLVERTSISDVASYRHSLDHLTPDVVLLSYETDEAAPGGGRTNHARRVSLWQRAGHGWQLVYHQATPVRGST